MKNNQIKIGAVLSYIQMGLSVIVSLIYTPLMIKTLGKSEYGLYNTVASTISMLSILNLGFNSSYIRYYSKYKKDKSANGLANLNGLFMLVFTIIGVIALLCGMFLTFNLNIVFKNGLTEGEYEIAKMLMVLLTINLSISFPMSVFANIISAHERFVFLKSLSMIKTVFSPLLTIPLLLNGHGSISIVIVTIVFSVFVDILYLIYSLFVLKVRFRFRGIEKALFKDLLFFASFIAVNIVVDQINLNIDKILLGRFKGTNAVAVYSVGFTLYCFFQQFSTSISSLFAPKIHMLVNSYSGEEQRAKLTDIFTKVARIQFLILCLVCFGLIFFGKPFIKIWAGDGYDESYYVTILLVIPSMIALTQNIGIEIQRAENRHRFRSIAYLIMALLNLIITIFLCQLYGAVGSAIGTAISLIIANGLIMNIYYHKKCNIDILSYWSNIFKMSLGLIIPLVTGIVMVRTFLFDSIWSLLLGIIIFTSIYLVSVWLLSMNSYEKSLIIRPIKRIFKKGIS